ncbi:MAG TPA: 50S ribosomal protein L30 [Candidatus Bathyarchaeia archaeon]|nr:50S ribosomal protein L30 [Candidatus Bathyarchaeia archaeon]
MAEPAKQPVILAVRIRGTATDNPDIRKTMETLQLESTFRARLLESSPSTLGMLRTAKNLVAWGQVNPEVLEVLLRKRAERDGNMEFDDEFAKVFFKKESIADLAKSIVAGEIGIKDLTRSGVKPRFRLHPPKGGFKRSTRRAATDGGELGYRGEDINRLVRRMI